MTTLQCIYPTGSQKEVFFLVFNATFYVNISVISWRSYLFVEKAGGPGENHQPAASH